MSTNKIRRKQDFHLVGHKSGQVRLLGGIILREGPDVTVMLLGPFLGEETKRSIARGLKLTVRHSGVTSSQGVVKGERVARI